MNFYLQSVFLTICQTSLICYSAHETHRVVRSLLETNDSISCVAPIFLCAYLQSRDLYKTSALLLHINVICIWSIGIIKLDTTVLLAWSIFLYIFLFWRLYFPLNKLPFLLLFLLLLMRFSSHDFYWSCFLYREAVVKWAEINFVALSWPFWSCCSSSGCGTRHISLGLHIPKVADTAFFTSLLSQYHHGCPFWW
jgi:hypothetical protein